MPKIAYEIGIDPQRKVTKEWIQEKLNAAKALMQGRIDEENLCADNPEQLMKTIKDRPTEVVAYDNCMKFFQKVGDSLVLGERTPYVDLFLELVNLCKASPDVAVVGGTLDSEMVSTFTTEDSAADGSDTQTSYTDVVTKDLEVPPNYIPMTWGELADLMIAANFPTTEIYFDGDELKLREVSPDDKKQYILDNILNVAENDYVCNIGYSINWNKTKTNTNYYVNKDDKTDAFGADPYAPVILPEFGLPNIFFDQATNTIKISEMVQFFKSLAHISESFDEETDYKYTKASGATTVRFIPEFLCKVV